MLTPTRNAAFGQGARHDLQRLLDQGFCGPAAGLRPSSLSPPLATSSLRRLCSPRPQHQAKSYYKSSAICRRTAPSSLGDTDYARPEGTGTQESDKVQGLADTLEELERALGRPIQQAIEEDRSLSETDLDADLDEASDPLTSRDPVAMMRAAGAHPEDVIRRARQIYGDRLPENVLSDNEFRVYRRLYGDPISAPYEDFLDKAEAIDVDTRSSSLLDQHDEPIDLDHHNSGSLPSTHDLPQDQALTGPQSPVGEIHLNGDGHLDSSLLSSPSARALEVARVLKGEVVEAPTEQGSELEDAHPRSHPLTRLGKFETRPRTVALSQNHFIHPVEGLMSAYSNKHLKDMCEKTFGGPGLPFSPLTPRSAKSMPQRPVPLDAAQHAMGAMEANAFVTAFMPPTYASIMSVLVETRKRLGSSWLDGLLAREGGPRVLDAGAGGAGVLAWREFVKAHWDSMHSSDSHPPTAPPSKSVVLTGSEALRQRAASLLDNTTFIPRLPDYVHTRDAPTLEDDRPASQRKQFDVIIATHSLFGLSEDWMRKQHVQNLWSMLSSNGGVLILIEKGIPRGFEAVAGARDLLLKRHIAVPAGTETEIDEAAPDDGNQMHTKEPGMIIAPCTNHKPCPMFHVPGLSVGRRDFCSFQQRYYRPNYLQRILGAKDRNHDDVDFSYISVLKGEDLRSHPITSWEGVEDSLSTPRRHDQSPRAAPDPDHDAWVDRCQEGFDDIQPGVRLDVPPSTDMEPQSKIPATWNLPRLVFSPIKRRGHVILDVCTPAGKIERWTVPKSFSKQAYHDARKSQWGDLWALGAKTRIARSLRLGGPDTKEARRAKSRRERLEDQAEDLMEQAELERVQDLEEYRELDGATGEEEDDFDFDFHDRDESPPELATRSKGRTASGKAATVTRPRSTPVHRVESFAVDDVDDMLLNPPPSKQQRPQTPRSPPPEKQPWNVDGEELTPEEAQALQEWSAELELPDDCGKLKRRGRPLAFSRSTATGRQMRSRQGGRQTSRAGRERERERGRKR